MAERYGTRRESASGGARKDDAGARPGGYYTPEQAAAARARLEGPGRELTPEERALHSEARGRVLRGESEWSYLLEGMAGAGGGP